MQAWSLFEVSPEDTLLPPLAACSVDPAPSGDAEPAFRLVDALALTEGARDPRDTDQRTLVTMHFGEDAGVYCPRGARLRSWKLDVPAVATRRDVLKEATRQLDIQMEVRLSERLYHPRSLALRSNLMLAGGGGHRDHWCWYRLEDGAAWRLRAPATHRPARLLFAAVNSGDLSLRKMTDVGALTARGKDARAAARAWWLGFVERHEIPRRRYRVYMGVEHEHSVLMLACRASRASRHEHSALPHGGEWTHAHTCHERCRVVLWKLRLNELH
jgi:hypothetical protein